MLPIIFVIAAYLLGSISFAVVTSKLFGLADPRSYGSGNPGATNVLRSGKKTVAALTLFGDAAKGWLAVWLAIQFSPSDMSYTVLAAAVALAVFIGHLFPGFFRFRGGKGVATALGILVAINLWLGLATFATWLIIAFFFRYSSLAAIVASVFAPMYFFFLFGITAALPAVILMSALLVWRHRENMMKLTAGTESRLGEKKPASDAASEVRAKT